MCEPNTFPWIILNINLQEKIIWSEKGKYKVVGKEMEIRVSRKYSLLYKTMVWLDNQMKYCGFWDIFKCLKKEMTAESGKASMCV